MFEKVKSTIKEIMDIADSCPDKYQLKCFEILLGTLLKSETVAIGSPAAPVSEPESPVKPVPDFFSTQQISQDIWQHIFHYDGNAYSIIVSDLKEKATSKKQVKLALLLGVKNLLEKGEATVLKQELRSICKHYAALDSTNFAQNMKKQKQLFLSKGKGWELTHPGQDEACKIIKELAQG